MTLFYRHNLSKPFGNFGFKDKDILLRYMSSFVGKTWSDDILPASGITAASFTKPGSLNMKIKLGEFETFFLSWNKL